MLAQPDHMPREDERPQEALGPYLRALRAHPFVIVAMTAVAVAMAVVLLLLRSPTYETTANVLVTPLPQGDPTYLGLGTLTDSGDPTRTVQTAASLVDSARAAAAVAADLGEGWSRERVDEQVEVEPLGESNILAVTASADDPRLAARLATGFARAALRDRTETLQAQVGRLIAAFDAFREPGTVLSSAQGERLTALRRLAATDDPTLSLSQEATAPSSAVGAPASVIIALALVAGFTLGSIAALLIERSGRTIRDAGELLTIFPLPVLTRVPLRRGGRRSAAVSPFEREAFRSLQTQLDQQRVGRSRSVLITSASSGDGKTTAAINLAHALVAAGHRVILLDLDLRRPEVGRRLRLDESQGIASLLGSGRSLEEVLQPAPDMPSLRVAPAGTGGEGIALVAALNRQLPMILYEASKLADYVVIDTPPLGLISDALPGLSGADDIIIVARVSNTDSAELRNLRGLVERSGRQPTGMVVVGDSDLGAGSYYTYGAPEDGPPPGPPHRAAPDP